MVGADYLGWVWRLAPKGARAFPLWLGLGATACASHTASPRPPSQGAPTVASPPAPSNPRPTHAVDSRGSRDLAALRLELLEQEDTDCDQKITVEDRGPRQFAFTWQGQAISAEGAYQLSNLLQEISLALEQAQPPRWDRLAEPIVERTQRLIRSRYWPALTRSIDASGIARSIGDTKVDGSEERYLYVPGSDPPALAYFKGVATRYNQAFEQLSTALGQLSLASLIHESEADQLQELRARLQTEPGRMQLYQLSTELHGVAAQLPFVSVTEQLQRSAAELASLVSQASRRCVHGSTRRLGEIAQRARTALQQFRPQRLQVGRLPPPEDWPAWVEQLGNRHGVLSLKVGANGGTPFVVPGGRFNEMYGWDSYFITLGLLHDGYLDLAKAMVDNFVYSVQHYTAILNANRTYYLTRSQPPFLTSMIRAVWNATPVPQRDPQWLRQAVRAASQEYRSIWSESHRAISTLCAAAEGEKVCLARYEGRGRGQPPEVEPGHFDELYRRLGISLEASYNAHQLPQRDLAAELDTVFRHDRCMRESGHDTTYRWHRPTRPGQDVPDFDGNRCADMATVDLNSLLYKYELDLWHLYRELSEPEPAKRYCQRAQLRARLLQRHLWSKRDGMFYDAWVSHAGAQQTGYVSATTLYPLWASQDPCPGAELPLSAAERSTLVTSALAQLEAPGGLLASSKESRQRFSSEADRQWDYPYGWAPHQILAWRGLAAHGFDEDAKRLALSWLYTVLSNAASYNGTIVEKYDLVKRSHAVFAEYGNVGTQFDYLAQEGFGWVNASVQLGLSLLGPEGAQQLNRETATAAYQRFQGAFPLAQSSSK